MTDVQRAIHRAVKTHGVGKTSRVLGMSRNAVLALAAGAPVRAGTVALAEQRIERLASLLA